MAVSLDKLQDVAPALVEPARRAKVSLEKVGLDGHKAKVVLCLDYSSSMRHLYLSGEVQSFSERILAAATQLDDDGAIDVFAFGSDAHYLGELTYKDFAGGVDRLTRQMSWGSTNYAAAIKKVRSHFIGGTSRGLFRKLANKKDDGLPVYTLFATDGAPDSEAAATQAMTDVSGDRIFWQFAGIGGDSFSFLRRMDTMTGRKVDNAGFFQAREVAQLSNDDLYAAMLKEYPTWLSAAKTAGIL